MKKTIKLLLLATAVLVLMVVACSDSDSLWIRIGKTATGENYYDKNSIHQTDQGIRIIKTKAVYGAEGKKTKRAFLESIGKHEKTPRISIMKSESGALTANTKKSIPFPQPFTMRKITSSFRHPNFPTSGMTFFPNPSPIKYRASSAKNNGFLRCRALLKGIFLRSMRPSRFY